ncbi:hypothetical protein Q428_14180 [Fervidicella metallireducens AeB]|uniref:Uncharacterized protein n=1 Tax=Fervidicella metallireducens AeB TaxID=1403537 RepID=A0A017RRJ3_9CLOT|nr:RHS repeat-associated core domain-containing protein [Fervidicella metallireducens]EYE87272.1 hypothetical protein Q428_14180 [Fervidicella metallireducens AeB]
MGRQLASISGNGINAFFKYNAEGIRTEKTVGTVTTKYHLVGDKVTFESNGTDTIYYSYDSSDNLIAMKLNGVEYYYIRNAQGDILGLLDGTGTQVVSYTYDSWGKLISIEGSLKDSVGVKNPYRYRGYRYDTEAGMYYLNSRYYSPEFCRMLNADDVEIAEILKGELLGSNLFAYCMNDPINETDSTGFMLDTIFDIISIGRSISYVASSPTSVTAWVALSADIGCAFIPGATGGGTAVRAASKSIASMRRSAVRIAWKEEQQLVKATGKGTRAWNKAEKKELLSTGKVRGYHGHHINSVKKYPHLAGLPSNIRFLKRSEHLKKHGGNWRNQTTGRLIYRR